MSVRNRYASNFTKVAPFSPSSRLVSESRILCKKPDDSGSPARTVSNNQDGVTKESRSLTKMSDDNARSTRVMSKKVENVTNVPRTLSKKLNNSANSSQVVLRKAGPVTSPHWKPSHLSVRNNIGGSSSKTKNIISNSVKSVNTKDAGNFEKNNISEINEATGSKIRRHSDESRYESPDEIDVLTVNGDTGQNIVQARDQAKLGDKRDENFNINHQKLSKKKFRRHSDSQCELKKIISLSDHKSPVALQNKQSFTDRPSSLKEQNGDLTYRPKSARPSSRWERRPEDEVETSDDNMCLEEAALVRPKSARPESRLLRHIEIKDEVKFQRQETPPPRPTTSRGHRKKEDPDCMDITDGTSKDYHMSFNKSDQVANFQSDYYNEADKKTRWRSKPGIDLSHDKSIHGYDPQSFRKEQLKVLKAKDVLDLNSGIDDIALDIDPVVYFMQDDDVMTSSAINSNKPSLSKDVINIIGKISSEAHQKPPIGYHNKYVNKQRHKSDGSVGFYRNEQFDSQNLVRDSDQLSFESRQFVKDFGNKKQKSKKPFRPHAYSDSDSYSPNLWPKSDFYDSVSDKVISKYSTTPVFSNKDARSQRNEQNKVAGSYLNIDDDIALRKPRKLEPLSNRYHKNSKNWDT